MNIEDQDEAWCKFAAAALQALVSGLDYPLGEKEQTARHAAEFADAMLKEWEKR